MNFAAQAVIAIENTRLLNELRESLQQQTATADVLKVIAGSAVILQPVFKAMLENAMRICEAKFGTLFLSEGDAFRLVAIDSDTPVYAEWLKHDSKLELRGNPQGPLAQIAATKKTVHIADLTTETPYIERNPRMVALVESVGARTFLGVPMLKGDTLIGAIRIYRQEVRPFTDKQIELVQNFAAQAVIAIENARLLNELRESLQQQTATCRRAQGHQPLDLRSAIGARYIGRNRRLGCAKRTWRQFPRLIGSGFQNVATYGYKPEFIDYIERNPIAADRGTATGRAFLEGRTIHIPDVLADPKYTLIEAQKIGDYRTVLACR